MLDLVVELPDISSHLAFLKSEGAGDIGHSGRRFIDHLHGTWRFLCAWGMPEHICLAGLYHSVYSTNAFSRPLLGFARRPELFGRIGPLAEQLVYLFCIAERPRAIFGVLRTGEIRSRLDRKVYQVKHEVASALLHIECANLIEQCGGQNTLRRILALDKDVGLSDAARQTLEAYLASPTRLASGMTDLFPRTVHFRRAQNSDADDLFDLARELHVESNYAWLFFDDSRVRKLIQTYLSEPRYYVYVAVCGEEVVGFLAARREEVDFAKGEMLRVHYLYAKIRHKKRCVAGLMRKMRHDAVQMNVIDIELMWRPK